MPTVTVQTTINAPRSLVFDLARDVDVHVITTSWTGEKIVAGVSSGKLMRNDLVTFEARHLGFRQQLTARISEMEYPSWFEDVLVKGAFSYLKHTHRFSEISQVQTAMIDILEFTSPLGILGQIADVLFLKAYMHNFLIRKNSNLKSLAERSADVAKGQIHDEF
jgi:ligand-binding SRPBCC domain-containing protein